MIKHIVAFKFKNDNKETFMQEVKRDLENLVEIIEELKSMEVGINYVEDQTMPDLSLYSTFENKEGLKVYSTHPEHVKVVTKIKTMATNRWVVDYEI
ncbi:MAG: Dabb family protein [Ichthyobacteriaceae bacterium]|nr:Dabb family protein [Ichthyobacteriaceae bacterium]